MTQDAPTVVVLPGDGIGRHVVPAARAVLDAAGFRATYVEARIGWDCWRDDGDPLPARTRELVAAHGLALFGAITSKPKREAEAALPAHLRGRVYTSPILALRRALDLATSLRPCRSFAGHPTPFVRVGAVGPLRSIEQPAVDVLVVSQNTECLAAGVEWTDPPATVRAALASHPAYARFVDVDHAISVRVASRAACRAIAEQAFARARRAVALVDKWGVMQETASLFLDEARAVAARFPAVAFETMNFDAAFAKIVRRPDDFDVVLASALIGDVLSDGFAAQTGGLGFAPSASIGPRAALFEPCHGSAPRLDVQPHKANPCAAILAAAMLVEHVGDAARADAIRAAVARVVADGRVRTYDLGGDATTEQMAEAVAANV